MAPKISIYLLPMKNRRKMQTFHLTVAKPTKDSFKYRVVMISNGTSKKIQQARYSGTCL